MPSDLACHGRRERLLARGNSSGSLFRKMRSLYLGARYYLSLTFDARGIHALYKHLVSHEEIRIKIRCPATRFIHLRENFFGENRRRSRERKYAAFSPNDANIARRILNATNRDIRCPPSRGWTLRPGTGGDFIYSTKAESIKRETGYEYDAKGRKTGLVDARWSPEKEKRPVALQPIAATSCNRVYTNGRRIVVGDFSLTLLLSIRGLCSCKVCAG